MKNDNILDWQTIPQNTKKFLQGACKDFDNNNKLMYLTPIVLNANKLSELKSTFALSVKKVGYYYSAPVFSKGVSILHKNDMKYITSYFLLAEFDNWLKINYGMVVPNSIFEFDEASKEVVEKYVKFKSGTCEKMMTALASTNFNGKTYGFKVVDEVCPFRVP